MQAPKEQPAEDKTSRANKDQQGKPAPRIVTDEQILAFAKERALNIKKLLIEEHGIDSGRLFICNPEIDDAEDAKPRVDLTI